MSFVHLHNHTQYSLLDGACRVDKMAALAKSMGMEALAMTDHGNMFGAIDFYTACQKAGIKPIIGIEAYIIPGEFSDPDSKQQKRHHLVLLAKNHEGYKNLCKLSTYSFRDGFYYKPRITKSHLREHHEGLICLSACIQGEIPSLILGNRADAAARALGEYKEIFGEDFYIELQDHGIKDERQVMPKLIELARASGTKMVVTNDCHYLHKEDKEAHDILLCIQTGHKETDPKRMQYNTDQLYFKSESEMRMLFPDLPEAYENTVKIASEIDLKLDYDNFLFPKMDIPSEYENSAEYLKSLCYESIGRCYGEINPEIQKRLDYELQIINKMGFNDYFLIVRDFIQAARAEGIPVGPGRGSAAGSIVSYLLDITQLDPLKYGLLFERFLNLSRKEMPDIDIDIDSEFRDRVIEYVIKKYGSESVCQIITFGTLGAKTVVRDVARVLDVAIPEVNKLCKLIPDAAKMTLDKAYSSSSEFRDLINSSEIYQRILRIGKVLEGLIRQTGIHAAGVVIGPGDLSNYVPLSMSTQKGNGGRTTLVQYEGKWLEHLKLLKMDFLGLKTLTLIRKTLGLVEKNHKQKLDMENVSLEDKATFELLSRAETDGVFQLESSGMKKYLKKLKPNRFDDIIAMVALYRPGPMQYIDTFIKRKHGEEEISYSHPVMEKALKDTYGVTVYQEQVMQVSKDLASFDSALAGKLRKVISKKKVDQMAQLFVLFEKGALGNGVKQQTVEKIWNEFQEFAQYAFNKSHAACYAFVSYQTAYLKAHYPVEFMAALMSEEKDPAKIPGQIEVCKDMGIEVVPPDINQGDVDFTAHEGRIYYGLKGIKNVGAAAVSRIIAEREANGTYEDIWDFCIRLDSQSVNKSVIESLVEAGAFDGLNGNRAQNHSVVQMALDYASTIQKEKAQGQLTLFEDFAEEAEESVNPQLPELEEWSFNERLEREKEVLGFYWSGHPLHKYKHLLKSVINFEVSEFRGDDCQKPGVIYMCGLVNKVELKKSRRNNSSFAVLKMEDMTGKYELVLFSEKYDQYVSRMKPGKLLLIKGSDNSRDSKEFCISPEKIYELDKFPGNLQCKLQVVVEEENFDEELCELLEKEKANGEAVKLNILLKTKHYNTLMCQTGKKVSLSEKFLRKIEDKTGKPAQLILD